MLRTTGYLDMLDGDEEPEAVRRRYVDDEVDCSLSPESKVLSDGITHSAGKIHPICM